MGYDADRAINKARQVVAKYDTRDPWRLARRLPGIKIVTCDLGSNIMGYTLIAFRKSIINLSSAMSDQETNSVLTHEIGHSLLTRDSSTNYFYKDAGVAEVGSSEYIANCFMFQYLFGDRGGINPINRNMILAQYGLPAWMNRYFDLIS